METARDRVNQTEKDCLLLTAAIARQFDPVWVAALLLFHFSNSHEALSIPLGRSRQMDLQEYFTWIRESHT